MTHGGAALPPPSMLSRQVLDLKIVPAPRMSF
jgi:hypothetical protein